jgi:hypothetical protein
MGSTSQLQKNIIAQRILGLGKRLRSDELSGEQPSMKGRGT